MSGSTTISGGSLVTVGCQAPPVPQALVGVPQATLLTWRLAAQTALNNLMTGASLVSVEYAEGQGHRKVIYKTADMGALQAYIAQLNAALGTRSRNPIRIGF